nr:hypothetical protein Hi04_10k_c5801_00005 [uncultured bacterium]
MSNTERPADGRRLGAAVPLLFLLYPILVDTAVATHKPAYAFAAMCVLALITLPGYAARLGNWLWLLSVGWIALSYLVCFESNGLYLLYLPPPLICLVMMAFFGRTLRAGSEPLITRISRAMRGGVISEEVRTYTRKVTILWVTMFGLLALESSLLAIFAPPRIWSLFTNLIDYLIIASVLTVEFFYHTRRYPNPRQRNFSDFAREMVRIDFRKLLFD